MPRYRIFSGNLIAAIALTLYVISVVVLIRRDSKVLGARNREIARSVAKAMRPTEYFEAAKRFGELELQWSLGKRQYVAEMRRQMMEEARRLVSTEEEAEAFVRTFFDGSVAELTKDTPDFAPNPAKAEYYQTLRLKYEYAAGHPQSSLEPDPPVPQ